MSKLNKKKNVPVGTSCEREERLSEALLDAVEVDQKYLVEALEAKDGTSLYKNELSRGRLSRRRGFVIAACAVISLLVIAASIVALPLLFGDDAPETEQTDESGEVYIEDVIDSLDKLNYYGGKMVIENGGAAVSFPALCSFSQPAIVGNNSTETSEDQIDDHVTDDGSMGKKDFVGFEDISESTFRITTAINFFINVPETDPFLYGKVGAGRVEVMLTDIEIDGNGWAMITFKNGERFFSCLSEGYALQDGENHFGTHLYIENFSIYKDLREGVSTFYVNYNAENESVDGMWWRPYNRIPKDAPTYDMDVIYDSVTVCVGEYVFTKQDVMDYYSGKYGNTADTDNGSDNNNGGFSDTDEVTENRGDNGKGDIETTFDVGYEEAETLLP